MCSTTAFHASFHESLLKQRHLCLASCLQLCGIGLGNAKHMLVLPECTCLNLYRADGLDHLDVTAPKLRTLDLQACYSLEHVRLYPGEGSSVDVNLINANIDGGSLDHFYRHGRVGSANVLLEDSDEDEDWDWEGDDLDVVPAHVFMDDDNPDAWLA